MLRIHSLRLANDALNLLLGRPPFDRGFALAGFRSVVVEPEEGEALTPLHVAAAETEDSAFVHRHAPALTSSSTYITTSTNPPG